jgi:N-methylhydantoinase A
MSASLEVGDIIDIPLRRRTTPVEIVTLRVDALEIFSQLQLPELPSGGDPDAAIVGHPPIALATGRTDAPNYDRARLGTGNLIAGPAILTQLDVTLLLPGQTAQAHRFGGLIVHNQSKSHGAAQAWQRHWQNPQGR